jgi:hypothetical protein
MMRKVDHDVSAADADAVDPQKPSVKLSQQRAKVKSSSLTTQSSKRTMTKRMMRGQVEQAAIQKVMNETMMKNARAGASDVADGGAAEQLVT